MAVNGINYHPSMMYTDFVKQCRSLNDIDVIDKLIVDTNRLLENVNDCPSDQILVLDEQEGTSGEGRQHKSALLHLRNAASRRRDIFLKFLEREKKRSSNTTAGSSTQASTSSSLYFAAPVTGNTVFDSDIPSETPAFPMDTSVPKSTSKRPVSPVQDSGDCEIVSPKEDCGDKGFCLPKKTSKISSPAQLPVEVDNRFESLTVDMSDATPVVSTSSVPYIYLDTPEDPSALLAEISALNGADIDVKTFRRFLRLKASNLDSLQLIKAKLVEGKLSFHSSTPKSCRPLKVIIKGIPHTTAPAEVLSWLEAKGLKARRSSLLFKFKAGGSAPPFVVELDQNEANREILKISKLSYYPVKCELLRVNKNRTLVCYNCQLVGHSSHGCRRLIVCTFCGKNHKSTECDRENVETLFCIRCKGGHNAKDPACPALRKTPPFYSDERKKKPLPGPSFQKKMPSSSFLKNQSYAAVAANKEANFPPLNSTNAAPVVTGDLLKSSGFHFNPELSTNFLQAHAKIKTAYNPMDKMELLLNAVAAMLALFG